jgi:hypothetical protein
MPKNEPAERSDGIWIDEIPLRETIVKAYHLHRVGGEVDDPILAVVRRFLSGPIGSPCVPGVYWFEDGPAERLQAFVESIEKIQAGFARQVIEPVVHVVAEKESRKEEELAPNPAVFVASLAGPVAVKSRIDESLVGALIATVLIAIARLGLRDVERAI